VTTHRMNEAGLGDDPHSHPPRRRWIVAGTEADALRLAAPEAAPETAGTIDQLLIGRQEEAFARAGFDTSPDHHAGEGVQGPGASAAAQPERGRDR